MEHSFAGYRQGCRCDLCREANADNSRRWRERKYAARGFPAQPRSTPTHGTRSKYRHGCRCDSCTAANTAGSREWRSRPIENRYITHGLGGYTSGCRCEICANGHRTYMRTYMRKRRASLAVTTGADHGQDQATTG